MTLCIIPARGGSRGIPRKNLRPVAGIPLIAHTIRHAIGAARVDRVVVSTDDAEIAALARREGAEVVDRPATLSGDSASSESALLNVLDHLRAEEGYEPRLVVFLQCTSPVRTAADIDAAVATLEAQRADSLLSVVPSHGFLWRNGRAGARAVNYDPARRPRRQDMPPEYRENGSIYVFRPAVLRESGSRLGGRVALHVMDAWSEFEIDDPEDLELCDWILRTRRRVPASAALPPGLRLVALDFDGVLTDNRVWVSENGVEMVAAHRGDGMGLGLLRSAGIQAVVISKEKNAVVAARCRKLELDHHHGIDDKKTLLESLLREREIAPADVVFMGNDINDLECMDFVGCSAAPADAHAAVLARADVVLSKPGGHGAVRELCDMILEARNRNG